MLDGIGINPASWLKAEAKALGVTKGSLLVLASQNDPFNAGTPASLALAEWFAGVYEEVGYKGIHLRRLHYRAYDSPEVSAPDGGPYHNTEEQWTELENASKAARYLGYVDPLSFVDRRAPNPLLNVNGKPYEPYYEVDALSEWTLPEIESDLTGRARDGVDYPDHTVFGYGYDPALQPYLVEIWTEKSGDDANLAPLAARLGVNYIPGLGFQSVTNIRAMFERVRQADRPGRILYISDYDPAGTSMPVSVGRQTQFAFWQLEELAKTASPSIRLEPIALTQDQVIELELPRKMIKDADLRKGSWEDRFGEGAVEVDALEARYPGELARLVQDRVLELQDPTLPGRLEEAKMEADGEVKERVEEIMDAHEADEVFDEYDEIAERYEDRLRALSDEYEREVEPLRLRLQDIHAGASMELDNLDLELDPLPEGDPPPDTGGWMYDSSRDFVDQTKAFKSQQKK